MRCTPSPGICQQQIRNQMLRTCIKAFPLLQSAMRELEAIVHPLVVQARERFLQSLPANESLVLFDIPLLFETGGQEMVRNPGCL